MELKNLKIYKHNYLFNVFAIYNCLSKFWKFYTKFFIMVSFTETICKKITFHRHFKFKFAQNNLKLLNDK